MNSFSFRKSQKVLTKNLPSAAILQQIAPLEVRQGFGLVLFKGFGQAVWDKIPSIAKRILVAPVIRFDFPQKEETLII